MRTEQRQEETRAQLGETAQTGRKADVVEAATLEKGSQDGSAAGRGRGGED